MYDACIHVCKSGINLHIYACVNAFTHLNTDFSRTLHSEAMWASTCRTRCQLQVPYQVGCRMASPHERSARPCSKAPAHICEHITR